MAVLLPVPVPTAPPQRLVEWLQERFFPGTLDFTSARWIAFGLIAVVSVLLGRFGVAMVFARLRRFKVANNHLLVPALEVPTSTFVVLCGITAALTVVPLWDEVPHGVHLGEQGALSAVILWGIAAAGGSVIDHFGVSARERHLHVAAFIPLIKRTIGSFFFVFSLLVVLESLGFEVKTFLAGLGIGGLAFALAAQDTIANLFGSFVVVMDQPFYVGESIRVLGSEGTVEEIGLRSTRLRTAQRTQIVIPNKTLATEVITNFTRMPQRRVEGTLNLTYDNPADRIQPALAEVKALIRADPGVHPAQVVVNLADFGDAALKVQILYFTANPDWEEHMAVRERINLGILRIMAARGVTLSAPPAVIRLDPATARPNGPAAT